MKKLVYIWLALFAFPLYADDQLKEECKTKALLGRDVANAVNDGVALDQIKFVFPDAKTPSELGMSLAWAEQFKLEVVERMRIESDLLKLTEGIYSDCVKQGSDEYI
jgi:hypothetical protein